MARIGLLYLRRGNWNGKQILSESFVESVSRPEPGIAGLAEWDDDHGNASRHYGLLWWNNGDGAIEGVPNDAFWSWGLHDSLIVVIPSLDIVVSRTGKSWRRAEGQQHYDVLAPFLKPICSAAISTESIREETDISTSDSTNRAKTPYPSSDLGQLRWDPVASVKRLAKGSDNWPITWMDDDSMLTAYGDGWGFEPRTKQKLSLGFAIIRGTTDELRGKNLRSPSGERLGQGKHGIKASGLLMVDGVVYLLARNAGNATVAWSADRGKTWTWSDWTFSVSFGCPSFVNFGPDYQGSTDNWVYIVSPDSDSAYAASDQMVMARVAKGDIRSAEAYTYFAGLDSVGMPTWSDDVADRAPIFVNPSGCYRGAMTYSEGLKRFLWCQVLHESPHPQGPRFAGGFGVYDAPNPWGPWTTLFHTESWDIGPGESSSFPTKWMSPDGKRLHLLFSGDDSFSVRGAHILNTADGRDGSDGG